jgi:hypothetical protein
MTTAALNLAGIVEFWRVARRLHGIYSELDRTFELGTPPCAELEQNVDRSEPETLTRVCQWFESIDGQVQVWQLRQLLQSTNLQTEENLRYLIVRHLEKKEKTETDKEKLDFLLVQYFAHCAPHGVTDLHITLEGVARVLEPALGEKPDAFPEWLAALDEKLKKMHDCNSLEELQESGGLLEAREMKAAAGDQYFQPALLVAFTRFNFLARRAFFRAMHLDLHAIRAAVNELERLGFSTLDCREAGLAECESLEQVRHLIHQWKTPFRAPYSGGSSFQQLILLRQALERTLNEARGVHLAPAAAAPQEIAASPAPSSTKPSPVTPVPAPAAVPQTQKIEIGVSPAASSATPATVPPIAVTPVPAAQPAPIPVRKVDEKAEEAEEADYLQQCVADIAEQLAAMPTKHTASVSTINLGGCKLLIATWEAEAFKGHAEPALTLQKAVAARTILQVGLDRHKRNQATDLGAALDIAQRQIDQLRVQVEQAKAATDIDAAVNLAATAKRLLALVDEGKKRRN